MSRTPQTPFRHCGETTTIFVRMRAGEGALPRLIGLVCRRQFEIASMTMDADTSGTCYDVRLELRGQRSVATLTAQIRKLYDVEHVQAPNHSVTEDETDGRAMIPAACGRDTRVPTCAVTSDDDMV